MVEGILTKSQKETDRLKILSKIETKAMSVEQVAEFFGISTRQTYRIL